MSGHVAAHLTTRLIDAVIGRLTAHWLVGMLAGRLAGRQAGKLTGMLAGRQAGWLANQATWRADACLRKPREPFLVVGGDRVREHALDLLLSHAHYLHQLGRAAVRQNLNLCLGPLIKDSPEDTPRQGEDARGVNDDTSIEVLWVMVLPYSKGACQQTQARHVELAHV
eukprot:CAMPEP_0174730368 /NCGR_PEP_ID=MMETSP1094-20130205/55456_1 /TAXON_ID=156173 /ORGANISM="Chrysochromulina brevifilum, Strain UTEX LB 985" /LENGTH=167 /DNA_ID=CAMNT_0015932623 /DNA_START=425 /DNA_END=928 /DNA_ORIENTATION=-